MVKVKEDLTGQVFGRLKVLRQAEDYVYPSGKRRSQWLCECMCDRHSLIMAEGTNLRKGNTQSCGCWCDEVRVLANKKYNKYDLSGPYGVGWTSNTNREFYFDLEDYDKIKDYCWAEVAVNYNRNFHTLQTPNPKRKGSHLSMHQVLGFANHDHIDRNEFNNRKSNLRPCTRSQNQMNRSLRSDSQSGITGVSPIKTGGWEAGLKVEGEWKLRKRFKNKDDAIRARLQAEQEYFGEFAPQKHLYKQYGIESEKDYCEEVNDEMVKT